MDDAAPRADGRPTVVILQASEALGDSIVNLAGYRALRGALPGHRIVSLCNKDTVFRTALRRLAPSIFDEIKVRQPINEGVAPTRAVLDPIGPIEILIDTRTNFHALWSFIASRRSARRFVSATPGFILLRGTRSRPERQSVRKYEVRHRLMELALERRLPFDARLPILEEAAQHVGAMIPAGQPFIGIAPGPRAHDKFWSVEKHSGLARFVESIGHRAVYFLGPLETDLRPLIEANTPNARIIDMSEARGDDTYLPWLIHAAAARAAACVAAEAGIGHLIASHGRCLLTLAGPTDARQWKPVTDRWWLLRAQDFGSDRTADIPLDAVISATKEMLDWNARSAMAG